jgi:hypothetical protein|tara:strand:- start:690 stop:953 length:264 start_codon:yes stop_codon:yes gene_type:complete
MRGNPSRQIVIEYNVVKKHDATWDKTTIKNIPYRIISWTRTDDGKLAWKELKCPQTTFYGIQGYYRTLGLPVIFYNRDTKKMHKNLP